MITQQINCTKNHTRT